MVGSLCNYLAVSIGYLRSALPRAEGQALVEVALVISLVSIVALGTISVSGTNVGAMLGKVSSSIPSSQPAANVQTTTPTPAKTKKKKKRG